MYAAGPPAATVATDTLRLVRAERRAFAGPPDLASHPEHRAALGVYLTDLIRPYGLELRAGLLAEGSGHSYGEMAEELIAAAVPDGEPVDLLVLAMAMPDVRPGRATATYLSHVCPGTPLSFAVCDQGAAAGFTALRLARAYARSGGCARGLILVVEQATLHYEPPGPVAMPRRDAGVALLVDERAGPGPALHPVRQHAGVPPERAGTVLDESLAGVADATLILGLGLAAHASRGWPGVREVRVAPSGQPTTGVWWALLDEPAGPVLLADYDPQLGYLCLATVAVSGSPC